MEIKIGFIGLGLMGSKCTERLVSEGYTVYGYDRIAEKVATAEKLGVIACDSPAGVAQQADQMHTRFQQNYFARAQKKSPRHEGGLAL